MKAIIKKDNQLIIKLNPAFYPQDVIKEGILRFQDKFKAELKDEQVIISKKKITAKDETTALEFCDNLLKIIRERVR